MKLRALTAIVGLAAIGLNADCISYSQDGGTLTFPANYSYVPEGPNDRMVIFEGNVIVDDTVSITATDDGAGSCNFLGVDRGSPATLTVKTGGSITFSTAYGSPGTLKLSANSGQMATLNVEGGTVTVGGYIWTCTYWNSDNGSGGRGIVNVNAGTLSVPTFNLGANSDNSGTTEVNLNGGTLAVGKFSFRAYNRQQLKLQGGTLQATGDDIFDLGIGYADSEGRSLEVVGGKTTVFDTNGHNQRLPAELGGTGRLVLTGGGAVSFAGEAPSYGVTFDGVTLALRAGEGTTAPLALNLDAAGMNPVEVEVPAGASGRLPLVRVASATFSGAKLATHFTCASGMLVFADGIIWLDRNGDSRGALVYSGEGGSDTPDPGSYTFLAFANPSGGYVVGGDELVLTDDRAIISAVGDVGQTVMAPVKATSNARVEVEAVGRGELNLAGGLTANEIEKTGDGKVLFGFPTELNKLVLHDGTIDFGGNAFEGKSFELANENGAGRVVTLQNGSWREAPNVVLDYTGYELHFGRDFNFSFKDNGRFAIGYGPQGAVKKQALILDEGCGVVTLYGNSHNYCNFVGVDVDGESSLVLNGGTLHAVREGGDSGCIRIGSGGNSNVSGLVKVAGGNLIVDWDMTLASQYNGFNGGNGSAAFELESGTASIAQLYLGGATAASGKGSIRLTGGELSLKSFCCLPYNEQSLYIDNVTVHALCDDGNRAYKFMEKRGDLDTKPRSYVLGAHGV